MRLSPLDEADTPAPRHAATTPTRPEPDPTRAALIPRRGRAIVLTAVVGLLTAVSAAASPTATSRQQTCPVLGADPDSVTLTGPSVLWPADHRMVNYTLTAAETPQEAGDGLPHGVTLSYTVTVADGTGGMGGLTHEPDAQPAAGSAHGDFSVPIDFQLRAERAADGSGRTYRIDWAATFDGGPHTCSSTSAGEQPFVVTVPRDQTG